MTVLMSLAVSLVSWLFRRGLRQPEAEAPDEPPPMEIPRDTRQR